MKSIFTFRIFVCLQVLSALVSGCSQRSETALDIPQAVHTSAIPFTDEVKRLRVLSQLSRKKRDVKESQSLYDASSWSKNETSTVREIEFSPNGKVLASICDSPRPQMHFLDIRTGNLIRIIAKHPPQILIGIAFSPDSKLLASGGLKTEVWNYKTGLVKIMLPVPATSLAFSPDGNLLAIADSERNRLDLWDARDWKLKYRIGFLSEVGNTSFSPDGTKILSSTLLVLHVKSGQILKFPTGDYRGGTGTYRKEYGIGRVLSRDGRMWASRQFIHYEAKQKLQLWDERTNRIRWKIPWDFKDTAIAFSPDAKTLAVQSQNYHSPIGKFDVTLVNLWDTRTGRLKSVIKRDSAADPLIASVIAFSPDGRTLAIGGYGVGYAIKLVQLS